MDDEDDWNPSKAAGVCLMLLATCCENDVIQHVVPFIEKHINNTDWRFRDGAVMALGWYPIQNRAFEACTPPVLRPRPF